MDQLNVMTAPSASLDVVYVNFGYHPDISTDVSTCSPLLLGLQINASKVDHIGDLLHVSLDPSNVLSEVLRKYLVNHFFFYTMINNHVEILSNDTELRTLNAYYNERQKMYSLIVFIGANPSKVDASILTFLIHSFHFGGINNSIEPDQHSNDSRDSTEQPIKCGCQLL